MKLLSSKAPSEKQIQDSIMQALTARKLGFFWRQNNAGVFNEKKGCYFKSNRYSQKGVSDILGLINGRLIAIEVKTKKSYQWHVNFYKRIRPQFPHYNCVSKGEEHAFNQISFLENINKNGGLGFFTYSFEHVLEKLANNEKQVILNL